MTLCDGFAPGRLSGDPGPCRGVGLGLVDDGEAVDAAVGALRAQIDAVVHVVTTTCETICSRWPNIEKVCPGWATADAAGEIHLHCLGEVSETNQWP